MLRQKEKYLKQERQKEGSRSPAKRPKLRSPDIEKALSKWLEHPQQKGRTVPDHELRERARHFTLGQGPDSAAPNPANNAAWLDNFKRKYGLASGTIRKDSLPTEDAGYGHLAATPAIHSPIGISPGSSKDALSPSPPLLRDMRSNESLKLESPDSYTDVAHHAMLTDPSTSSFSHAALLSPTSPFFTPDSAAGASGSFYAQSIPVSMSNFQRPRSQSQPFSSLDQYMSPPTGPTSGTTTYTHSPHQKPLDSIDETMDTEADTISPAATMRAPPLPAHILARQSSSSSSSDNSSSAAPSPIETRLAAALAASGGDGQPPSQDEARAALQVVMRFFQQQPVGSLDLEESVLLGKIGERLTQERRRSKKGGGGSGGVGKKLAEGGRRASGSSGPRG